MSLTPEGYIRQRLAEIKSDYDNRFVAALGPVNTAPDAVVGQVIGIFSAALDDVYETMQSVYDSMYPHSAEGTSLDGAVSFVGLKRLDATATKATVMCYGSEGTLVPAGALIRSTDGKQYATTADTVISRSASGDVLIEVSTVIPGSYQVIAAGALYAYTATSGDEATDIVDGLAAAIDDTYFTAANVDGKLRIYAVDQQSSFPLSLDSKLSIDTLSSPAIAVCLDLGANALPAGALSRIDTAVSGWDSVSNLVAGAIGRDAETDEDLRNRHAVGVRAAGSATVAAIRARMLSGVESVDYCKVYENRDTEIDEFSLPPHSIETVVDGGTDVEVAAKLYELKPAGIETYGNTAVSVLDANGDALTVNFSRASQVYMWVRVSVDSLYPEEPLSARAIDAISAAVLAYGESLGIGADVIAQRFVGGIYAATTGIKTVTVEVAVTESPIDTPSYTTVSVDVDRRSVAVADSARITVIGL